MPRETRTSTRPIASCSLIRGLCSPSSKEPPDLASAGPRVSESQPSNRREAMHGGTKRSVGESMTQGPPPGDGGSTESVAECARSSQISRAESAAHPDRPGELGQVREDVRYALEQVD